MKNGFVKLTLLAVISFGTYWSASAQVYVQIRPVAPVIVQPTRPSAAHVWIGEEWNEEGRGYKYSGGHWATPPHPGDSWNQGHWNHGEHGDNWVRGGWGHGGGRKK
jgi:hypothetical protein